MFTEWTKLFIIKRLDVNFSKNQKQSPGLVLQKKFLKIKLLQNSWKIIRDVVFNLKNFRSKGRRLYWKESRAYALSEEFCRCFKNTYFVERREAATSEISSKDQNSSTG